MEGIGANDIFVRPKMSFLRAIGPTFTSGGRAGAGGRTWAATLFRRLLVNGNWRLTFTFEGVHAVLVDYQDYH